MYYKKRKLIEWICAIKRIMSKHKNKATYLQLYNELPDIMNFNSRECELSGLDQEIKWRGTLRGHLSDLYKIGIIHKTMMDKQLNWWFIE